MCFRALAVGGMCAGGGGAELCAIRGGEMCEGENDTRGLSRPSGAGDATGTDPGRRAT
jgi:hypothetical protein